MKLTIKDKKPEQSQNKTIWNYGKLCCTEAPPIKKKLIPDKIKPISNLIYADITSSFVRLLPKNTIMPVQLHYFIIDVVQLTKCPYGRGLGFLATHAGVCWGVEDEGFGMMAKVLSAYKPIYWRNNEQMRGSVLNSLGLRIQSYCSNSKYALEEINFPSLLDKYLDTLLLEYIPTQYTEFILALYLDNSYQQFIRLCVSLIHFVLNTRNVTSAQHAEHLLQNAYMGVIQWPIVISNRENFVDDRSWSSSDCPSS